MPDTPMLTDEQREALAHAVHEAVCCDDPEEVVVSGFREAADDLAPFIARMVADAERRGREDNADHGQCYVHGSRALEARLAEAWDEGRHAFQSTNPYRADRIGGESDG